MKHRRLNVNWALAGAHLLRLRPLLKAISPSGDGGDTEAASKLRPLTDVHGPRMPIGAEREGLGGMGLENIARRVLVREGVAAIWQLHLAAARAYRDGLNEAATGIVEIADAAEREWLQGKVVVRGSPG